MKKVYKIIFLAILPFVVSSVQIVGQTFDNDQTISPEASRIIDKFSRFDSEKDTGAIILFREAKMIVNDVGTFKTSYHIIGRVYDEYAKSDFSQIPVVFNSYYEDIKLDFARTIDKNKSVINISKDAIQIKTYPDLYGSINYTDLKILAFSLPALGDNKIFEYQISIKSKRPVINNHWFHTFNFNLVLYNLNNPYYLRIDSVLTSRFTLTVPSGTIFKTELNNINATAEKSTIGNQDLYLWEVNNLSPIFIEQGMPYLYEAIPIVTVSSIMDWKDFGKRIYSDISKRIVINKSIKTKVEELISNAQSEGEKVKAIYDYVNKEIDYIQADLNRGGLIPHYSNEILKNEYGDCKDQATILISLLQAAGIEAYPALITTYSYRNYQKYIPKQYFDHLIVYLPTKSKEYWLDPTSESNDFSTLYWVNKDKWALVLDENGGLFIGTPSLNPEDNIGILNVSIRSHKQSLKGNIEILSQGAIMNSLSSYLQNYSRGEQVDLLRDLIESYYESVSVGKINIKESVNSNDYYSQFINFDYLGSTKDFRQFTYESNIPLAFYTFFIELPGYQDGQKRVYDYRFPFKFSLKGTEVFHSPWKFFSGSEVPNDDSLITEQFNFHQKFTKYKDSVVVIWSFNLHNELVSKDNFASFNEDLNKLETMLLWEINFYKDPSYLLKNIPASTKTIIFLILILFGIFSLIMLIDAYKREPKKTNWIWLSIILATGPFGSTVYYFTKKRPRDKLTRESKDSLYCSECGEEVNHEAKFCPRCGSGFE